MSNLLLHLVLFCLLVNKPVYVTEVEVFPRHFPEIEKLNRKIKK